MSVTIPTYVQKIFDEIVAEASDDADKQNIRKALEAAWADQRMPDQKSCFLESRERNTFYDVKMKVQTRGSRHRWRIELKVTQA